MPIIFRNCRLVTENEILFPAFLTMGTDGYIKKLGEDNNFKHDSLESAFDEKNSQPCKTIDLNGNYLLPGLIDCHTHGAHGFDFMDGEENAIEKICYHQLQNGVTGFLATIMTGSDTALSNALAVIKQYLERQAYAGNDSNLLGINLEGPFINSEKKGIHDQRWIKKPDRTLLEKYVKIAGEHIKIVSIAPELDGALDLISWCRQRGIIASAGHTNATYEELNQAFRVGLNHGAHLFNAMTGIHHRAPGAGMALLLHPEVTVELVCDKNHLHPAMIALVLRLKPLDKIMLVSDSTKGAGLQAGSFQAGDTVLHVKDGQAKTDTGKLAGSTISLSEALIHLIEITGLSFVDAVKTVSLSPAKKLGVAHERGSLLPGKRADAVIMDSHYNVLGTVLKGEIYWWRS